MARKVSEIYEAIIAYKDNQTFLADLSPQNDTAQQLANDLDSTSKVAIWRLWAYIVSVAIYLFEVILDLYKVEIETKISQGIWGTIRWYQAQSFKFQFGDSLTYNSSTGHYEYAVIDATKQIIARCAVIENNGNLLFKVAKIVSSVLTPLTQPEQDAFNSYLSKIKFAGTHIQVISGLGDLLRIELNVVFDPIVPQQIIDVNVQTAITNYVSNLDYNALFRVIHLIDAIQAVDGVVDVISTQNSISTRISPASSYVAIAVSHIPYYGYYRIDSTAGNTLNDTLTYTSI